MKHLADNIIKHKIIVLIVFIVSAILSMFLSTTVSVNYNLMDYLPEGSPSTVALDVMFEEFTQAIPNARVLVKNVSVPEALNYKQELAQIDGVEEVLWLDDSTNVYQPLDMIDEDLLNTYYKDSYALFSVVIDTDKEVEVLNTLTQKLGDNGEFSGDAIDSAAAKLTTGSETSRMILAIVPLILIVLFISTSSWFEPVLFMLTIGVAIILNMGTNFVFGEVSFITQTTAGILQLAVSMDYSIFLLHRFSEYRARGLDVKESMIKAMKKSFSSIFASGLTTAIGFGALVIMRFKIGADLGVVLAKGILFSMLAVMLLLPVLTVLTYKLIDKTHHRSFLPSFNKFGRLSLKIGLPIFIIIAIIIVPSFLAQNKNDFLYGAAAMSSTQGEMVTDQIFGKANTMVVLVPNDDLPKQQEFCDALEAKSYISSIVSYTNTVGATIPQGFVPENSLESLESQNYSRIILTVATSQESQAAFSAVEEIRQIGQEYYGENYYLSGGTTNVYDMRETVQADNVYVTILSVLGIGIVILFAFKSAIIPILLLLTIEASIWINLAVPYFTGEKTAYIGFMIISSIQLGATVDYAILMASRYIENRQKLTRKKATVKTVADTAGSILTSGIILMISGFIMGFVSTNTVIAQLGTLIGRGTFLSASFVLFLLPFLLVVCDNIIQKTSLKYNFYKEGKI